MINAGCLRISSCADFSSVSRFSLDLLLVLWGSSMPGREPVCGGKEQSPGRNSDAATLCSLGLCILASLERTGLNREEEDRIHV